MNKQVNQPTIQVNGQTIPVPTPQQLAWHKLEYGMLCSFTTNTFNDTELGTGIESPATFNPADFDAEQWISVAKEVGAAYFIIVSKHHEGFCIWQTATTDYSVKSSPWRNGHGDVVREVADACVKYGIKFGIYYSPYDMHEPSWRKDPSAYDVYFKKQLTELLTNYGESTEVWFDGAGSAGHTYDWKGICELVRRYQPNAIIFNMGEATIRWSGNENGVAPYPCWNVVEYPLEKDSVSYFWSFEEEDYPRWMPVECDVSLRKHWFWHANDEPKPVEELVDIYHRAVGRGANLLLGIAPDTRGKISKEDAKRLKEFWCAISEEFANKLVVKTATASNVQDNNEDFRAKKAIDSDFSTRWATDDGVKEAWLEVGFGEPVTFNRAVIMEAIDFGERVNSYQIQYWDGSGWREICKGISIGHNRIEVFDSVTSGKVRLNVKSEYGGSSIREFVLYRAK